MSPFEPYHQQHQEILALVTDLMADLSPAEVQAKPGSILQRLSFLSEKIRIHLAQEDLLLYPELLRHPDQRVRDTARRAMASMGDLQQVFRAFRERWADAGRLAQDPGGFIGETRTVFEALAKRMLSEEAEIYPLARPPIRPG